MNQQIKENYVPWNIINDLQLTKSKKSINTNNTALYQFNYRIFVSSNTPRYTSPHSPYTSIEYYSVVLCLFRYLQNTAHLIGDDRKRKKKGPYNETRGYDTDKQQRHPYRERFLQRSESKQISCLNQFHHCLQCFSPAHYNPFN